MYFLHKQINLIHQLHLILLLCRIIKTFEIKGSNVQGLISYYAIAIIICS